MLVIKDIYNYIIYELIVKLITHFLLIAKYFNFVEMTFNVIFLERMSGPWPGQV